MVESQIPIAVDVMGGDHGSSVIVEGAVQAARQYGIRSILVGNQLEIQNQLKKLNALNDQNITIFDSPVTVTMEDSPSVVFRSKANSSLRKSFELVVSGAASAVVSTGNTGAMMAAGIITSGTLAGIERPAIATFIPRSFDTKPTVLLDSGANIDCDKEQLMQFSLMGSAFAQNALKVDSPKVGLLSNGTESSKGTEVLRQTSEALAKISDLNFIGYVEGKDIPKGTVDVVVCDGFVGNVVLKAMEGTASLVVDSIKESIKNDLLAKFGMLLARRAIKKMFKSKLDPSAYGGAPLLGLKHVAMVCHGSSNATAILNAIKLADQFVKSSLIESLSIALGRMALSGVQICQEPSNKSANKISNGK